MDFVDGGSRLLDGACMEEGGGGSRVMRECGGHNFFYLSNWSCSCA